jgi:hypothetical protein
MSERANVFSSSSSAAGQSVFPVTQISVVPEEEALTSVDASLLGHFLEDPMSGIMFGHGPCLSHKWSHQSYPISSESFRYTLLVRASKWANSRLGRTLPAVSDENTYRYLSKAYQLIRRSAAAGEYREVVYSSYILFGSEFLHHGSTNDRSFIHCIGMWQAFGALGRMTPSIVSRKELLYMEELAHWALRTEYNHLSKQTGDGVVHEKKEKLFELLRATSNMGDWYWEELGRERKIWQLSTVFQIYSHYYVLQRNHGDVMDDQEHQ